ncbi:MAG TPA: hypothetical protein ENL03_02740, partial [Phycisphaerae bacterium]|nr:hypothetical protein [Phycisphaerae bacterium]
MMVAKNQCPSEFLPHSLAFGVYLCERITQNNAPNMMIYTAMTDNIKTDITESLDNCVSTLLAERNAMGVWEGQLSSSALSTSTSVMALSAVGDESFAGVIESGLGWLGRNINEDGGWGDTPDSPSNIATTLMAWSAFGFAGVSTHLDKRAKSWLIDKAGSLEPASIAAALVERYGGDRTFSVPILSACILSGRLGDSGDVWQNVPELPFELALVSHRLLKSLALPVVSYA